MALLACVPPLGLAIRGEFDGLYGQDAFAYFEYAMGPLRASLARLQPPPPFYWPPGYPLLVAISSLVVGERPLAGQLVSLAAAAGAALFTALLAYEACRRLELPSGSALRVPLLAGLLVSLNGQMWQSSIVVMSDTTGLMLAALGGWALLVYLRRPGTRWLALAAGAIAAAIVVRWAYALVALPLAAAAVVGIYRTRPSSLLRDVVIAGVVVAALLAPVVVPVGLALPTAPAGEAPFAADLQVYSWHPLNALRRDFVTFDGELHYSYPNGLYYMLAPGSPYFFTPLLAIAIPFGVIPIARRRDAVLALMVVGWVAVVYAFHAGAPWQNFRFTLAFLPPLAILVALGVDLGVRSIRSPLVWVPVGVGLMWMIVAGASLTQSFIDRKAADLALVGWIRQRTPPEARVISFGFTPTLQRYAARDSIDLFDYDPPRLAALLGDGRATYVLVDTANLESQWQARPPGESFRWLMENGRLTALEERGAYTLFRVDA